MEKCGAIVSYAAIVAPSRYYMYAIADTAMLLGAVYLTGERPVTEYWLTECAT